MPSISPLQKERYSYKPKRPEIFSMEMENIGFSLGPVTESVADQVFLRNLFPLTYGAPTVQFAQGKNTVIGKRCRVGVVLSGGQAPGGHNVIAGLYDALKKAHPDNSLYGFQGGPAGIIEGRVLEITEAMVERYRNTGGFDIIGSGRNKIEKEEHFEKSLLTCQKYNIDSIVVIGGDDSNTNAAVLAEWFKKKNAHITVVGCPKTIDGDLKNEHIETSFGFDTATKTYSELIGNIARDARSARKYWHFIKLMGRSASHITLECALQTQPNLAIISEEIRSQNLSLSQVIALVVDVVLNRAAQGKNFGVVLIPEGLIEFIPEMGVLIAELNDLLARENLYFETLKSVDSQREWVNQELSKDSSYIYSALPRRIQMQLLDDRDPHGNVQVSRIETEKLLIELVGEQLEQLKIKGKYQGRFEALAHFFGYEGRCAFPSNFDADYGYNLGFSSFLLVAAGFTGYIAQLSNLHKKTSEWLPGGVPLTMMMNMEQRHGKRKPVIRKALVLLEDKPFQTFALGREAWAKGSCYLYPGAIQYYGSPRICDQPTMTLRLEKDR